MIWDYIQLLLPQIFKKSIKIMAKSYKEQLSEHVEAIFKEHVSPGLHICDIATGGGKLTVSANRYHRIT